MTTGYMVEARVVEPVLDHAAAGRARLVNDARAALLKSGGAVTIEMIAEATGRTRGAVRQSVTRQRNAGSLVTVTHEGIVLVPTFQFDDALEVRPDAAALVARLVEHGMSGWAVWDWFATPNTWLDGTTPADALTAGDIDAVHGAASGMFQE